jgi:hypothetical protein
VPGAKDARLLAISPHGAAARVGADSSFTAEDLLAAWN